MMPVGGAAQAEGAQSPENLARLALTADGQRGKLIS